MHNEISRDTLIDLYVNQNMTDAEIATQFSRRHWHISQLRKKYRISGINARQREFLKRPPSIPMTDRQQSILMGTLLGDGCLKQSGSRSYLSVSHSVKQKQYLEWIHSELSSFCHNSLREEIHHGKYTMYALTSESREDLASIRNTIYIPRKTIVASYFKQLDALGLAVWYMDDGSLAYVNGKTLCYCFATNSYTEEEQISLKQILFNNFGLETMLKPAISQKGRKQFVLIIASSSFDKFTNLVRAHVHPSMHYKLPGQHMVAASLSRMNTHIDKEALLQMYEEERLTQEQIAIKTGTSISAVRKHMNLYRIAKRSNIDAQLKGKNNRTARSPMGQFVSRPLDEEDEQLAKNLFTSIKTEGIAPRRIDSHHAIGILERLCNLAMVNEDEVPYCRTGIELCVSCFPHILNMAAKNSKSPLEIYNDDALLMDSIRRTIRYAKNPTLSAVKNGLKTYRNNRSVTIFPPAWAKQSILRYALKKNNKVLDFSCGFGGRLLGAYASGQVAKYVGIDPLKQNILAHEELSKFIQTHANLRGKPFETLFINGCAEDELGKIDESFDIVLTCPPYFDKEKYSGSHSQCYIKHNAYDEWVSQWLYPVLSSARKKLNNGGVMIIFMSDYAGHPAGKDCEQIMSNIFGHAATVGRFVLPSLEYLRKPQFRKLETAWIAYKT